jgi:hypothetical protein
MLARGISSIEKTGGLLNTLHRSEIQKETDEELKDVSIIEELGTEFEGLRLLLGSFIREFDDKPVKGLQNCINDFQEKADNIKELLNSLYRSQEYKSKLEHPSDLKLVTLIKESINGFYSSIKEASVRIETVIELLYDKEDSDKGIIPGNN